MTLQAGQLFGNYRVVRLIGEGGFGEVYLVENELIQRRAAVKVLHPALAQDAELVRRFLNEARAASAICHPNIVEVLDAGGTPDGAPYILMEFLEGVSLQKRLADSGPVSLPKVLDLANQAGSALVAAHAAGIVHRDLKPENLFLVPDIHAPGGERVKVLDFGIAKICLSNGSGGTVRTRTGMIIGSPAYMSPEQCKDSADVDVRSDVYSFATILYEMLSGRTPHVAPTGTELLFLHLTKTPQPLRELVPHVPANVGAVIMRGLAREREERFNSMESFVAALREDRAAPAKNKIRPAEIVSAVGPRSTSVADQTPMPARNTTFSRSTGEVGEVLETEESILAATRSRRWPVIAMAGVVVLSGAMLVLLKPNHDSVPRRMVEPNGVGTGPAAMGHSPVPVREEESQKDKPSDLVVLPTKAATNPQPILAGEVGGVIATKPSSGPSSTRIVPSKRAKQAAGPTTSRPTGKEWNANERWLAH